jgi:hypothetical protein
MAFKYVNTESQGDVTGKVKTFHVDAGHTGVLGPGDIVRITGQSNAAGLNEVDTGVADTANTGVIAGVTPSYAGEALSRTHLPASTAGTVTVNVDAFALYDVPVSNGPLVAANVGLNCPAVVTAGTVSGGIFTSNMGANATGVATTATLPLQIVGLLRDEDGVLGNRALVRLNATTSKPGATGI